MTETCLEITNLSKIFGKNIAIEQLNLVLTRSKKVALLGLNGAGKSSFIRLLVGESRADKGLIHYAGWQRPTWGSLMPQDHHFKKHLGYQADTMLAIPAMNGRQYLTLCAQLKGVCKQKIKQKIALVSQQWQIEHLLDQKMQQLSKGNLQKLAIAQVFIGEAKWLFFDEPCQSLDPLEQDRFNQKIKALSDIELCLFSTHNVHHALEVADDILLFHQSRIAYHFSQEQKDNYLLVLSERQSKEGTLEPSLMPLFEPLTGTTLVAVSPHIYQIQSTTNHVIEASQVEALKKQLKQKAIAIEFCLPESQAVMPLFRLLASGEIKTNFSEPLAAAVAAAAAVVAVDKQP